MALVTKIEPASKEGSKVHGPVECRFSSFTDDNGNRYLQLDTFGSADRQIPGKISQSIQFNEGSAAQLIELIQQHFVRR